MMKEVDAKLEWAVDQAGDEGRNRQGLGTLKST